jgi:hypothetical protein
LVVLGGCAGPGPVVDRRPEAVVAAVRGESVRGLPVGAEWRELEGSFSEDFRAAVAAARKVQERQRAEHPDEKPDWIEGDFFGSLFEGPDWHRVGGAVVDGEGRAEVSVACSHSEGGSTVRWSDKFILVREAGAWRIDDVEFGGTWDFAAKGSLKEALRAGD